MTLFTRLASFLRSLVFRSRVDREMDDELQFHLDSRSEDLIATGLTPAAARERARREFGDARRWKESGREARGLAWLDGVRADVRYGLRWIRRSPAFAAAAIVSLAVGIGANTAIFSLVNAVVLKRLPVEDPRALVLLGVSSDTDALGSSFPYPFYRQLRGAGDVLSGVLASASMGPLIEADGPTERVGGELVSGNYFDVLGVRPHLGRLFSDADDVPGAGVVVLSHGYWQRRFAGDPKVIGRTIRLNQRPMTVIGVTPPAFHGIEPGGEPSVRVPISLQAEMHGGASRLESPHEWWLQILARKKRGVSHEQAVEVLGRQYQRFRAQLPSQNDAPERLVVLDGSYGRPTLRRTFTQPLVILTVLVAVILLLVCVNVGNLLLARGTARQREMSLRLALGAGRLRIVRQLVVETLVLAVAGGLFGLLLSFWGARALAALASAPSDFEIPIDLRVLGFATIATVMTGLVCGLAPAWSSRQANLVGALKTETVQITAARTPGRQLLVAGQIALSLTLLVGAGLFARTLFNLRHAGFGFDADRLASASFNPGLAGYSRDRARAFFDDLRQRLSTSRNIESSTLAMMPLLAGDRWGSGLTLDTGEKDDNPGPTRNAVGPEFFRTVGLPMREGREFSASDIASSEHVAIVNEAFVRRYFAGGPALGRRIGQGGPGGKADYTIVGVTRDSKVALVREVAAPFWYVPIAQVTPFDQLTLHVRATGAPEAALADVRSAAAAIDRHVPLLEGATLREQIEDQVEVERLMAVLANVFAGLAAMLACLGLYGVMSYVTHARAREVGVRMALGASPRAILLMMFRQSAFVIGGGALGGVLIAYLAGRQVESLLFDLQPNDPVTLLAATAIALVVTTAAALLPARRAARINPALTLH